MKILTRSVAAEWAKHNNQTNGIGSGYFATSHTEQLEQKLSLLSAKHQLVDGGILKIYKELPYF